MASTFLDRVLGTEPKTRLRLTRSLGAAGVGIVALMIQYLAVAAGITDAAPANALCAVSLSALALVYVAIRSGWSRRLKDPALTMPQMVMGIVMLAAVYAINPAVRGMAMLIMAMTLVFGAFILPPRRCRQLGWLAVVLLGAVMTAGAIVAPQVFEPRIEAIHFMLVALVLPVIARVAGQLSELRHTQKTQKIELRQALEKLRQLATHDELTGLPNRRQILELLALEDRKAARQNTGLCCCLIDIDHFKQINDTMGHLAGDETLQLFSQLMARGMRAGDLLARWGGEEFLLLLPATTLDEATMAIERLRQLCADPHSWKEHPDRRVTFSAGLAQHRAGDTSAQSIARADAALYQAKHQGRNRVVVSAG